MEDKDKIIQELIVANTVLQLAVNNFREAFDCRLPPVCLVDRDGNINIVPDLETFDTGNCRKSINPEGDALREQKLWKTWVESCRR